MTRILSTLLLLLTISFTLSLTGCFHHGRHHGNCGHPCTMSSEQCAKCAHDGKTPCPDCPCKAQAAPEAAAPAK